MDKHTTNSKNHPSEISLRTFQSVMQGTESWISNLLSDAICYTHRAIRLSRYKT